MQGGLSARIFTTKNIFCSKLIDLLYAPLLTSVASRNLLLYQSPLISIPCRHANVRRRKDDTCVGTTARSITE